MQEKLNTILKAINLAHFDNLKTVVVEMADLLFLRETVKSQSAAIKRMQKEIYILQVKVELQKVEQPINLDSYKKLDAYALAHPTQRRLSVVFRF